MIEIHPEFQYSSFLFEPHERLAIRPFLNQGIPASVRQSSMVTYV